MSTPAAPAARAAAGQTPADDYVLTITYVDGGAGRSAVLTVDGAAITVAFHGTISESGQVSM